MGFALKEALELEKTYYPIQAIWHLILLWKFLKNSYKLIKFFPTCTVQLFKWPCIYYYKKNLKNCFYAEVQFQFSFKNT